MSTNVAQKNQERMFKFEYCETYNTMIIYIADTSAQNNYLKPRKDKTKGSWSKKEDEPKYRPNISGIFKRYT